MRLPINLLMLISAIVLPSVSASGSVEANEDILKSCYENEEKAVVYIKFDDGEQIPMIFQDTKNLSKELMQVIVSDLNHIHSHLKERPIKQIGVGKEVFLGGCKGMIKFSVGFSRNQNYFRPEKLDKVFFGRMVEFKKQPDKKYILLSNELVDVYEKAAEIANQNNEIIQELFAFIDLINRLGRTDDYLMSHKEAKEIFFVNYLNIPKTMQERLIADTVSYALERKQNIFADTILIRPSILNFFRSDGNFIPKGFWVVHVPHFSKSKKKIFSEELLIYSNNNKWKIALRPI